MPPRSRYSIESFGPEVLAALLSGARKELILEFPDYKTAKAFQIRASKLRSVMRDEKHALYPAIARARISVLWGSRAGYAPIDERCRPDRAPPSNPPTKCIIKPHDEQFRSVLEAAGVRIDPLETPHPSAPPPVEEAPVPVRSTPVPRSPYLRDETEEN